MISPHLNQLFENVANWASPSILEQQVDLATTNNNSTKVKINKGNAKRGVSLTIWPCDLDLWPMTLKINRFQIPLRTKYVLSLVKIHWRMLILECSQGCYGQKEGRKDGSITISLRNFVGEGIIKSGNQSTELNLSHMVFFIIKSI